MYASCGKVPKVARSGAMTILTPLESLRAKLKVVRVFARVRDSHVVLLYSKSVLCEFGCT